MYFLTSPTSQESLILLAPYPSTGVSDTNGELLASLNYRLPLLRGDAVRDGGSEPTVLHHQHLQLSHIVHQEVIHVVWVQMSRLSTRTIPDVWHLVLSLEATSDTIVNPLWLAPYLSDLLVAIRLVTYELLGSFFYNLSSV